MHATTAGSLRPSLIQTTIDSPVGLLTLAGSEAGVLSHLAFGEAAYGTPVSGAFTAIQCQLAEYFEGSRRSFDVPLALTGTDWQRRVVRAGVDPLRRDAHLRPGCHRVL